MLTEQWKSIPGFNEYEASSEGKIRRSVYIDHSGKAGRRAKPGFLIKQSINGAGYPSVTLKSDKGNIQWRHVHVLIAETFLGQKPFEKAKVLHRDDNKFNNHISNLRWGSDYDNRMDCLRNGRHSRPSNAIFTDDEVRLIRKLNKEGITGYRISKIFKKSMGQIYHIINNRYYKDVL